MQTINLDRYGGAGMFSWTHDYLNKVLTTGKKPIIVQPNLKHAFKTIKREDFLPSNLKTMAYEDKSLPLGFNSTLDKPTVIAEMLALMQPQLDGIFLDIGTGSGYVAALLSLAAGEKGKVYSVERVQFLIDIARQNLAHYPELTNLQIIFKDGSQGLAQYAPYDGIHISAAFNKIPEVITNQLKIGGKLVAPTLGKDVRVIERVNPKEFKETIHPGYFFDEIIEGIE